MNKSHASQCSLPLIWYKFEVKYYFNWSNQLQLDPLITSSPITWHYSWTFMYLLSVIINRESLETSVFLIYKKDEDDRAVVCFALMLLHGQCSGTKVSCSVACGDTQLQFASLPLRCYSLRGYSLKHYSLVRRRR